jgi:iron complex transport system substrate-binding protein
MSIDEVLGSIGLAGARTGRDERAAEVIADLRARLDRVAARLDGAPRRATLVLEWTDPAFTGGHWVPDMVEAAGGESVLGFPGANSQGVEWSTIRGSEAEVVLVAPCGYRLDGAADLAATVLDRVPPNSEVWAIDADAVVVRPGPRVVEGVEVMAAILHPERCGRPDPERARRIR